MLYIYICIYFNILPMCIWTDDVRKLRQNFNRRWCAHCSRAATWRRLGERNLGVIFQFLWVIVSWVRKLTHTRIYVPITKPNRTPRRNVKIEQHWPKSQGEEICRHVMACQHMKTRNGFSKWCLHSAMTLPCWSVVPLRDTGAHRGTPGHTEDPRLCAQEELSLYHSIVQEIQSAQEEGVKDTKWASWKAGWAGYMDIWLDMRPRFRDLSSIMLFLVNHQHHENQRLGVCSGMMWYDIISEYDSCAQEGVTTWSFERWYMLI